MNIQEARKIEIVLRFGNIAITATRVDVFIRIGIVESANILARIRLFAYNDPTPFGLTHCIVLAGVKNAVMPGQAMVGGLGYRGGAL